MERRLFVKRLSVFTTWTLALSGFNVSNTKVNEKISIQIETEGYKPYKNTIYFSAKGCYIHSEEWNYNPNFKSEFTPKNNRSENETISSFNFHLVKI